MRPPWLLALLLPLAGCNVVLPLQGRPGRDMQTRDVLDVQPLLDLAGETTHPDGGCTTTTVQIADNLDDGEIDIQKVESWWLPEGESDNGPLDPAGLYIGYWSDGPTWVYLRFLIPVATPGTTVGAVRLRLHGALVFDGWDTSQHALSIALEDAPDPAQVTSLADDPAAPGGRPIFGLTRRWPESGGLDWSTVQDEPPGINESPDIGPLIQARIAKYGPVAGDHIQLWLRGDFSAGNAEVATFDSSMDPGHAAELSIEWCP